MLQSPRPVFAALRDDSREAAEDRQDVVAAIAFFVGLALTLLTAQASNFADDPARKGIVIPVWLFIAGLLDHPHQPASDRQPREQGVEERDR